nr:MAG TPA: hypothetical protein [Herelleviridae sp.]
MKNCYRATCGILKLVQMLGGKNTWHTYRTIHGKQ